MLRKIIKEEVEAVTQAPAKKGKKTATGDKSAADAAPERVNPALVADVLADALGIPSSTGGRDRADWLKHVKFFNSYSGRFGVELPFEGPLKGAFYGEIRRTHLAEMGLKSLDGLASFLNEQGARHVAGKDDMAGADLGDLITGM
jgi:hypothetical protein